MDDYASINGTKFLDYGRQADGAPLVYDVTQYWVSGGANTFTATSTAHPQASCQPFKVVLIVTPGVSIGVANAGDEGTLGGTIPSIKVATGTKPFEKHFVSP